ncbi:MAG: InlB B-repeat-containing protein, partial [Gaiellales bacterium]
MTAVALALPVRASALDWVLPATDFTGAAGNAFALETAVAGDGTVTAVWVNANAFTTSSGIQVATRRPGQANFDAPQTLTTAGATPEFPQVASAPDGTTTVVWRNYGTFNMLEARTRAPGASSFGPPQVISEDDPPPVSLRQPPQNAVGPDGAMTVIWVGTLGSDVSRLVVKSTTRAAGASSFPDPTATPPEILSAEAPYIFVPHIAVGSNGTTAVTWNRSLTVSPPYRVEVSIRAAGQSHFPNPPAPETLSLSGVSPWVAVGPAGEVTATWTKTNVDPTLDRIETATRSAGGALFGPPTSLSAMGDSSGDAQVAYGPGGDAVVVWGNDYGIQAASRGAGSGGGFASPTYLSLSGNGIAQVRFAPDGEVTAAWRSYGTGEIGSASRTGGASASWSNPTTLRQANPGLAADPSLRLLVAPTGEATATWLRNDGTANIPQFVSSGTTSYQLTMSTSGDGSGTVTSAPAGISCGSACTASFLLSTSITLTATPASGSSFGGWGGACSGTAITCRLVLLGNSAVTATFTKDPPPTPPVPSTPSNSFDVRTPLLVGSAIGTWVKIPGPGVIRQSGTFSYRGQTRRACTTNSRA